MSLFNAVKEDPVKLQERYQHLLQYAELLEVEIDALDEISTETLDSFQKSIERCAQKSSFAIDSVEHLDWYLAKRLELHSELEGVKSQYKKLISSIESKQNSLDYMFKQQAEGFVLDEYKCTGKKTLILPHGTVGIRSEKPSWKLGDENELQDWLSHLSGDDMVMFEVYPKSYSRNLDALKFQAEKGVKIPGLKYDEGGEKISIRLPKENE